MIANCRRLFGIVPYWVLFFPTETAIAQATEQLPANRIVRLFYTSVKKDTGRNIFRIEETLASLIDLSAPLGALWKNLSLKTAEHVRRAENLGARLTVRDDRASPEAFLELFNDFARAKRVGVTPMSRKTLRRYLDFSDLSVVYLDGTPICGHIMLVDHELKRARLLFTANRRLENPEMARISGEANKLLHWWEIRHYKELGFQTYDFGGIREDPREGITRFKTSFGGSTVKEYTYLCAGAPALVRLAQTAALSAQSVLHRLVSANRNRLPA